MLVPMRRRRRKACMNSIAPTALLTALLAALSLPATAAAPATPTPIEQQSRALQRASDAVLGVRVSAVEDARTAATLGTERRGSGVVIADDLVLTIGYLLLEADEVDLELADGRQVPARVAALDSASGFGLVQALAPLRVAPVPLGEPAVQPEREPLVVVSGGREAEVTPAQLLSRRAFSGNWEYHVEHALFTAPPRRDHPGAGLFNLRGELLGIGSLLLPDVAAPGSARQPGNLFVPVDLLRPILAELRRDGRSAASRRPWMGLNCAEAGGEVRITRVADDSPADVAGLQTGDRILRIDGVPVAGLATLWKTLWATAPAERAVTLEIVRDGVPQTVVVQAVDRAKTLRRPLGV
jgi:S1-C subfamily serine protease